MNADPRPSYPLDTTDNSCSQTLSHPIILDPGKGEGATLTRASLTLEMVVFFRFSITVTSIWLPVICPKCILGTKQALYCSIVLRNITKPLSWASLCCGHTGVFLLVFPRPALDMDRHVQIYLEKLFSWVWQQFKGRTQALQQLCATNSGAGLMWNLFIPVRLGPPRPATLSGQISALHPSSFPHTIHCGLSPAQTMCLLSRMLLRNFRPRDSEDSPDTVWADKGLTWAGRGELGTEVQHLSPAEYIHWRVWADRGHRRRAAPEETLPAHWGKNPKGHKHKSQPLHCYR